MQGLAAHRLTNHCLCDEVPIWLLHDMQPIKEQAVKGFGQLGHVVHSSMCIDTGEVKGVLPQNVTHLPGTQQPQIAKGETPLCGYDQPARIARHLCQGQAADGAAHGLPSCVGQMPLCLGPCRRMRCQTSASTRTAAKQPDARPYHLGASGSMPGAMCCAHNFQEAQTACFVIIQAF